MGGNFGRCRDGTIPGACFSRAGCTALGSVTGKRIAACRHLLRSCSTSAGITWQTWSGRFAVVVSQDAAESLATLDLTGDTANFLARIDQSVVEALVIALCVIEVRNTLPPNTKSAKCTIPGTRSSAAKFMFTGSSTNSGVIFVGVGCPGKRTGLVSRCRHGCLIERIVLS